MASSSNKRTTKQKSPSKAGISKLPTELMILSSTWKVTYLDNAYDVGDLAGNREDPVFGLCDYVRREITVYVGGRDIVDIWKTLMHEILHALSDSLALHGFMKSKDHEQTIDALSNGLVDTIVRNDLKVGK